MIFDDYWGLGPVEDDIPDAEEEEEDESPRAQRKLDKLNLDDDSDYL